MCIHIYCLHDEDMDTVATYVGELKQAHLFSPFSVTQLRACPEIQDSGSNNLDN